VPQLPGCLTEGDTLVEAKRMAREAIALWLDVVNKPPTEFLRQDIEETAWTATRKAASETLRTKLSNLPLGRARSDAKAERLGLTAARAARKGGWRRSSLVHSRRGGGPR
jgi:hypothetical protein